MMCKNKLKDIDGDKIYINEKLTPIQNEIFAWARKQVKNQKLTAAWTRDGKIYIKRKADGKPELVKNIEKE